MQLSLPSPVLSFECAHVKSPYTWLALVLPDDYRQGGFVWGTLNSKWRKV